MTTTRSLPTTAAAAAAGCALAILLGAPAGTGAQTSGSGAYAYVRTLDGAATLFAAESSERLPAEVHQPLLVGDRVWVAPQSRAELLLPDGTSARLGGDSELVLVRLAGAADTSDESTLLELRRGEAQLALLEGGLAYGPVRVDTFNSTVYLHPPGRYRLAVAEGGWSELIVREGFAEVVSELGSMVARSGEQVVLEGAEPPRARLAQAPPEGDLEAWGAALDAQAALADVAPVDPSLQYAAAPLDGHGEWVDLGGQSAFRPYADAGWRPYTTGRWAYTPGGYSWVSAEPWAWVTYHYGTWTSISGYGWLWFPGSAFSPAWVYWYWGPTYVGWVPVGYYTWHYGPRFGLGFDFHHGVYGWAGGFGHAYSDWVFCPLPYFGYRESHRHHRRGTEVARELGGGRLDPGIVTTDTRGLSPRVARDATAARELLKVRAAAERPGRPLLDVTAFVERRAELTPDLRDTVLVPRREVERPRLDRERSEGGRSDGERFDRERIARERTETSATRERDPRVRLLGPPDAANTPPARPEREVVAAWRPREESRERERAATNEERAAWRPPAEDEPRRDGREAPAVRLGTESSAGLSRDGRSERESWRKEIRAPEPSTRRAVPLSEAWRRPEAAPSWTPPTSPPRAPEASERPDPRVGTRYERPPSPERSQPFSSGALPRLREPSPSVSPPPSMGRTLSPSGRPSITPAPSPVVRQMSQPSAASPRVSPPSATRPSSSSVRSVSPPSRPQSAGPSGGSSSRPSGNRGRGSSGRPGGERD